MKRKISPDDSNHKMMKMSKTEEERMTLVQQPTTRISNSLTRNFAYKLSDKKAKSNLLKGAAKEAFEIAHRQLCIMLFFSVGSFFEAVIPTIVEWKNRSKCFEIENLSIKIDNVLPGYDQDGKHMDTLVTFNVNGQKITVCCYNTTQKIKVEGKGYIEFFEKYLEKLFLDIIKKAGAKIDNYNKGVIAALSGKRKIIPTIKVFFTVYLAHP